MYYEAVYAYLDPEQDNLSRFHLPIYAPANPVNEEVVFPLSVRRTQRNIPRPHAFNFDGNETANSRSSAGAGDGAGGEDDGWGERWRGRKVSKKISIYYSSFLA